MILRSLSDERKNSVFFASDKMAQISAVYHSIIYTCKMQDVSEYFKRFFCGIVKGCRGYTNMLPSVI